MRVQYIRSFKISVDCIQPIPTLPIVLLPYESVIGLIYCLLTFLLLIGCAMMLTPSATMDLLIGNG